MRLKQYRKIAPLLILFFTLSIIAAPSRAVLPLIAEGVMLIAEGGTAANALAALTVGSVAGIIYMGSNTTGSGSKSGSVMDIPLGSASRDRPLDSPLGYTPPASNNVQPVPPSSVPGSSYSVYASYAATTVFGATLSDAVIASIVADNAYLTGAGSLLHFSLVSCTDSTLNCVVHNDRDNVNANRAATMVCPAGYTLSGTSCSLSNSALVMKPADGRCQILASVGGFVVDPQDPECGELAAKAGVTVTPMKITAQTLGASSKSELTINADGSRTLTNTRSNSDGKTSTITNITFTPAANGQNAVVSGTSVVVVNGQGTAAGTAALPAAPAIDFPTDYNREVTQSAIKANLDAMKAEADTSGYALPPPAALTPEQLIIAENKKITDELNLSVQSYDNFKVLDWSTWIPVFPSASCTPISGSVMGKTITWDLCPKVAMLNETIGWLLSVFAAWSVVGLLFRKD